MGEFWRVIDGLTGWHPDDEVRILVVAAAVGLSAVIVGLIASAQFRKSRRRAEQAQRALRERELERLRNEN